jgi:putative oxidoreductase
LAAVAASSVLGLFTRPVAFVLAGEMAVAYWMFYFAGGRSQANGWLPVVNGGDSPIQFCFVFLYLVVSGAGAWSADRWIARNIRHRRDGLAVSKSRV